MVTQYRGPCPGKGSPFSHTPILTQTKLHMVASERDFAMSQLREMAEQVQMVADEFKSMSDHCDQILKELDQVRKVVQF